VKAVILAGGYGTRISEESAVRPKPMVEVGGKPIMWHVMKIYEAAGITDFVIAAGYRGNVIKEWFANYYLHMSDITFDLATNTMTTHASAVEPWKVTIVDTGDGTMSGGRLKRVREYLDDETFCMTYGDCVARLDVAAVVGYHHQRGLLATVTAVQPPGRFGALGLERDGRVSTFFEKPSGDGGWVSGGFFVLERNVLDYIEGDDTPWERAPMEQLAREGKLSGYRHSDYWQNLDTLRDKMVLEELWAAGAAPWKVW
jgi:glucose-1-phosphate cytidylyltransferase